MKRRIVRKSISIILIAFFIAPLLLSPINAVAEEIKAAPRKVDFSLPEENTETLLPDLINDNQEEQEVGEDEEEILPEEPVNNDDLVPDVSTGSNEEIVPESEPLPEATEEIIAKDPIIEELGTEEPDGILVELDEYSKTWQIDSDTFVTEVSGVRKGYEDENGNMVEVDNTLEEKTPIFQDDYYENESNHFTAKFPVEIKEGKGVRVEKDGETIEMIPLEGDFSRSKALENAVMYTDVMPDIDFQYSVIGDFVKEDIILNKYIDSPKFEFEIRAGRLNLRLEDKVVNAYKSGQEEPVFTISAPLMTDASGEASINIGIDLTTRDGKNIVTLTPDSEWLSDLDRAYPVKIDPTVVVVTLNKMFLTGVEQGSPDTTIDDNGYPYAGYDDGIVSTNIEEFNTAHFMTRTYVELDYKFLKIPIDALIESATFSLHHYTSWSKGNTNFGIYRVNNAWSHESITWNNQLYFDHTFVDFKMSNNGPGYITWDVRSAVNDWVKENHPNHGLVVKAEHENSALLGQAEVFSNKSTSYPPELKVTWSIPDPIDPNMDINDVQLHLNPITEKSVEGKLQFDGIFSDGIAKPGSQVDYRLAPNTDVQQTMSDFNLKYPDTDVFGNPFPNGTKYKDKLGNFQTSIFSGLDLDKKYWVVAKATYYDEDTDVTTTSATEANSDSFLNIQDKAKGYIPIHCKLLWSATCSANA